MFDRGIRIKFLDPLGKHIFVIEHEKYSRPPEDRFGLYDFEVGHLAVGEKIDRMGENGQAEAVAVALFISEHIFVGFFRQGDEIAHHIGIAFVERGGGRLIVGEENKILREVEKSACSQGDNEEREESDAGTGLRGERLAGYPRGSQRGHEKDRRLGADGAERVRQAFVGEKLRHEHDEE